jgi:uncharacterized membrane protein
VRAARWTALLAYFALTLVVFAWEAWRAPPTPLAPTFWIVLKVTPLIVPLPWLLRAAAYAHVLTSLLLLLYFSEGVAAVYGGIRSGSGASVAYGSLEIVLTLVFIAAASVFVRLSFRTAPPRVRAETES